MCISILRYSFNCLYASVCYQNRFSYVFRSYSDVKFDPVTEQDVAYIIHNLKNKIKKVWS